MGNNEMMLGVDGTLNIVPDHPATSATCGHRASIGISQRYLLVLGLHHQGVQTVEALNLLAQRRNLLVKPRDLGLRYRFPLAIGAVELREITGNALVNLRQPSLHLGLGEVPVPRVDGLELAAVNRNARFAEQLKASAQHHKLTADPADGLAIVLAEVGYCFEVRHQAAGQPNQLDVALALPLQAPARLYPIKVSVDVNLQQRRRMVSRPSRRLRLYAAKAQLGQIKLIDKDIYRSNRIVLAQIVIQPLRKQSALTAVIANDKARHRILRPNRRRIISLKVFSHSLGRELADCGDGFVMAVPLTHYIEMTTINRSEFVDLVAGASAEVVETSGSITRLHRSTARYIASNTFDLAQRALVPDN